MLNLGGMAFMGARINLGVCLSVLGFGGAGRGQDDGPSPVSEPLLWERILGRRLESLVI